MRDLVVRAAWTAVGSDERAQFGSLVRDAVAYVLDDGLASALERVVESDPNGIERNLDLLRVPPQGLWIEWSEAARTAGSMAGERVGPSGERVAMGAPGTVAAVRVGALLCPDPDEDDKVVVMGAWTLADGSVRQCHAAVAVSRQDLAYAAWLARVRFSRVPRESAYRILMGVHAYVPRGMAREIDSVAEVYGRTDETAGSARVGAMRDATADVIFVLAAVLAVGTPRVRRTVVDAGAFECSLRPHWSDRAWRVLRAGFRRRGRNAGARVRFRPPAGLVPAPQRGAGA